MDSVIVALLCRTRPKISFSLWQKKNWKCDIIFGWDEKKRKMQ